MKTKGKLFLITTYFTCDISLKKCDINPEIKTTSN